MVQYKTVVRTIIALLFLSVSLNANAQTTTTSPYSKFGLGELRGDQLPQFRGMGGISTGIRSFDSYFNINVGNPASYSALRLTTLDAGLYGTYGSMSRNGTSQTNASFNLSHLNFGIPVSSQSALSFGLMPYSSVGYRFSSPSTIDTLTINNVYSGDGDISKAYLGYGIQFGKHISLGFNANYLFGKLRNTQEAQYPQASGALNTKVERSRAIKGLNLDFGVQYTTILGDDLNIVIGYAGNASGNMRLNESEATYRTFGSSIGESEGIPLDSIEFSQGQTKRLTMPLTHKVGISFNKANKWLVGADANVSNWADYKEGSFNPGLQNSYGFALGGQYTPDVTSTKYFNVVSYRFGVNYNKSNIKINNKDVNEMGVSVGLGLPLPSNRRSTFYKVNLSAEFMQRGSSDINLVKENFINFHVGFTLNDRWFQRYKYD